MTILHKQEPREDDADNPVRIAFGAACPPDVMEQLEERFGFICLEGFGMSVKIDLEEFARTADRIKEKADGEINHNRGGSLEELSCGFTGENQPE